MADAVEKYLYPKPILKKPSAGAKTPPLLDFFNDIGQEMQVDAREVEAIERVRPALLV